MGFCRGETGADGGLEGWGVGVTHPSWDSGPGRDLRHPLTSVPAPFSLFEWEWGEIEGTRDNVESSSVGSADQLLQMIIWLNPK